MNYAGITYDDIANGPGIRVTLFVQGCDHKCPGCHNPETWDYDKGMPFTIEIRNAILDYIESTPFVQGLTISGGDPLNKKNIVDIKNLLEEFRNRFKNTKDIWLYTGFTWTELHNMINILKMVDVIVDGPFKKEFKQLGLKFKGSTNQNIIDVQKSIKEQKLILWRNQNE